MLQGSQRAVSKQVPEVADIKAAATPTNGSGDGWVGPLALGVHKSGGELGGDSFGEGWNRRYQTGGK